MPRIIHFCPLQKGFAAYRNSATTDLATLAAWRGLPERKSDSGNLPY
jgi:hypothetical protein